MTLDNVLSQVREGMSVVDTSDEEIGTVETVQLGDPGAVTAEGQAGAGRGGVLGTLAEVFGDRSESPQFAAQLARTGYLKVDTKGLGKDLYASSEQVAEVSGETVRLNVAKDRLYS